MEPKAKRFPTLHGFCVIYSDRVEIVDQRMLGRLNQWLNNNKLSGKRVFYIVLILFFLLAALVSFVLEIYFLLIFFMASLAFVFHDIWKNRKLSFAPLIPKKDITEVHYLEAVPGERRAAFHIYFQIKEKVRLRRIQLPRQSKQTTMVAQSAYQMMKDAGLL